MSLDEYNDRNITAYLLGSLPEEEAEYFDEMSFTDEEFADALKAMENELIDRYIHGELSGETLENVKSHYLASPLRRAKIKFAKNLQVVAKQHIAKILIDAPEKSQNKAGFFSSFVSILNGNKLMPWGVAAAALLILVLGGVWFLKNRDESPKTETAVLNTPAPKTAQHNEAQNQSNNNQEIEVAAVPNKNISLQNTDKNSANTKKNDGTNKITPTQKPLEIPKITIATLILAPPLRGSNQLTNLQISKETTEVNARLQLETDEYPNYRVALSDENGKILWQSGILQSRGKAENKSLNIRFPAKLLKLQIYSFVVSGIKSGETEVLANYTFQVVIK